MACKVRLIPRITITDLGIRTVILDMGRRVGLTKRCGVYSYVVQTAGVLIVPDIRSPKDKRQPRILFHQGYVVITGNMY